MVYLWKVYEVPFGKMQAGQMKTAVEEVIADLAHVFPPSRPKDSGVQHQHFEEALEKHGSGNCRVYHLARWVAIDQRGVKDPVLSQDLILSRAHHNRAYVVYRQIAPLIQAVSLLFQAVDPQMHLHYFEQYRYVWLFFTDEYKLIV